MPNDEANLDPSTWDPALDAVIAAPANHKVVFENDRLRVLEVTLRARRGRTNASPSLAIGLRARSGARTNSPHGTGWDQVAAQPRCHPSASSMGRSGLPRRSHGASAT